MQVDRPYEVDTSKPFIHPHDGMMESKLWVRIFIFLVEYPFIVYS